MQAILAYVPRSLFPDISFSESDVQKFHKMMKELQTQRDQQTKVLQIKTQEVSFVY